MDTAEWTPYSKAVKFEDTNGDCIDVLKKCQWKIPRLELYSAEVCGQLKRHVACVRNKSETV